MLPRVVVHLRKTRRRNNKCHDRHRSRWCSPTTTTRTTAAATTTRSCPNSSPSAPDGDHVERSGLLLPAIATTRRGHGDVPESVRILPTSELHERIDDPHGRDGPVNVVAFPGTAVGSVVCRCCRFSRFSGDPTKTTPTATGERPGCNGDGPSRELPSRYAPTKRFTDPHVHLNSGGESQRDLISWDFS